MSGILVPYQTKVWDSPPRHKPTISVYYSAVQPKFEVDGGNYFSPTRSSVHFESSPNERPTYFSTGSDYKESSANFNRRENFPINITSDANLMKEQLRRSEVVITEHTQKSFTLQQRVAFLESENKSLQNELHRLTSLYNNKIGEIEKKYHIKVENAVAEIERPGGQLDQQRLEYENRLRELDREWGLKFSRHEEKLADKDRLITKLEEELRKTTDHIDQIKYEYEEQFRKRVSSIQEEEEQKYKIIFKNLELKLHELGREYDIIIRNNQDLQRQVQIKEKEAQDQTRNFDVEASRLKNEINDLKNKFSLFFSTTERLSDEICSRDITSNQLGLEVINLQIEAGRSKDIQAREMAYLISEQNNERRRWEETERQLRVKLGELERIIKALGN